MSWVLLIWVIAANGYTFVTAPGIHTKQDCTRLGAVMLNNYDPLFAKRVRVTCVREEAP
jgi:hypothetical protein